MVRKLSLAIALVMGISPLGAYAVGLGKIQLNSALNQYFDADIELLSVDREEISDIKVKLASPEAFSRSGVDRPFILSKLRFQAEETADGRPVIRVFSRDPIREPFLNFLVEVNWPKGKLLREYTVLLDPPTTLARKPAPVQAAPMQARPATGVATTTAAGADRPRTERVAAGNYGPTQRNDTLWGIAKQVRVKGASMAQTMIALQQANPQAFINRNINNLKVGEVLRIPTADEVFGLSREDAATAYREQLYQWQADSQPTEMAADSPVAPPMGTTSPADSRPLPEAELKIASARPAGQGEGGASEGASQGAALELLKQNLIAAEEQKEAALQEAESVRSRVEDLESQLSDLQRLLSLKSEQLKTLQDNLAGGSVPGAEEAIAADPVADTPVVEQDPQAADTVTPESTGTLSVDQPAAQEGEPMIAETESLPLIEEPAEVESPVMEQQPETEASPVMEQAPETVEPVLAQADATPEANPVAAAPAVEEDGLLEMIAGDTTLLGVAVAGILVLLALLWVAISRRRSSSADFQESILISTVDDADSEQLTETLPEESVSHSTEETSFLSDFSPSDIDALQDETGEVDPLAEADVYIAYGRYQQAEELIRQAIEKSPERSELKQKLFEILYATKDKDAYVTLAEQAAEQGLDKKDPEGWTKVVGMGALLAADHALFAGAADGQSTLNDDDLASLEQEFNLDDDLGLDEVSSTVDLIDSDTADNSLTADSRSLDDSSEFSGLDDLEDLSLDSDLESTIDSDNGEIDLGLDLSDALPPLGEEAELLEGEDSLSLSELDADTDFSMQPIDTPVAEQDDSELHLTLDGLEEESLEEASAFAIEDPLESAQLDELNEEPAAEAEQLDEAVIGFSDSIRLEEGDSQIFDTLELDQTEGEESLEKIDSFSLDDLDQEDEDGNNPFDETDDLSDEINTKLDLARAYVDMEDADGARNILEEVLVEGNTGQQKEAQSLLDELA